MKRILFSFILVLSICSVLCLALASKNCETYGLVPVYQGPSDFYYEICTLPSGMAIQAIEYEIEDGKLWHLFEFNLGGKLYRGYAADNTPIAFESASGYSEAYHSEDEIRFIVRDEAVYAAPSRNAAITGEVLKDETVTVLDSFGDLILIDYEKYGRPCRGYISSNNVTSVFPEW